MVGGRGAALRYFASTMLRLVPLPMCHGEDFQEGFRLVNQSPPRLIAAAADM